MSKESHARGFCKAASAAGSERCRMGALSEINLLVKSAQISGGPTHAPHGTALRYTSGSPWGRRIVDWLKRATGINGRTIPDGTKAISDWAWGR